MDLRFFRPHPLLRPHVEKIWIFEKDAGFLPEDIKTIVPNGMMKLVFPYRGSLFNTFGGPVQENPEATLWVVGAADKPATVDSPGPLGMLGIELHPGSAYRFFSFSIKDGLNLVASGREMFGAEALELQGRLMEEPTREGKVRLAEEFLLGRLMESRGADPLVDYAVDWIKKRRGAITVRELSDRLGYSSRYLDRKFADLVGVGPKTLARLFRFQEVFAGVTRSGDAARATDFLDAYVDQSHLIKEFKLFSGLAPTAYSKARNDFLNLYQSSDFYNAD